MLSEKETEPHATNQRSAVTWRHPWSPQVQLQVQRVTRVLKKKLGLKKVQREGVILQ